MNFVSGGLADSKVKFSSDIPCRTDIRELIAGTLCDAVEVRLVDDVVLLIDGDRIVEVEGLVEELDAFCGRAVGGSMIIVSNGGENDLYVQAFEILK